MRKTRSKYKLCKRLGYNAILRRWYGKKKKWEGHPIYIANSSQTNQIGSKGTKETRISTSQGKGYAKSRYKSSIQTSYKKKYRKRKVVNPVIRLKNELRIGSSLKKAKRVIRRKDTHNMRLAQKRGRKRIYGGIGKDIIRHDLLKQRAKYKEWKRTSERNYRKGSFHLVKPTHRMAGTEQRVDVRRWRSGRVPTLQIARDLIEHHYVYYVNHDGERMEPVKWQGARIPVGCGRKISDLVWTNLKELSRNLVKRDDYKKTSVRYREVDYVTGRRVVLRQPRSGEVMIPSERKISMWNYF